MNPTTSVRKDTTLPELEPTIVAISEYDILVSAGADITGDTDSEGFGSVVEDTDVSGLASMVGVVENEI